jgi:hypothetical protein
MHFFKEYRDFQPGEAIGVQFGLDWAREPIDSGYVLQQNRSVVC